MDTSFCLDALEDAVRMGAAKIRNADQDEQFANAAFTDRLEAAGMRSSMDRPRVLAGQCFRRAAMAQREVRKGPPEAYADGLATCIGIGQVPVSGRR